MYPFLRKNAPVRGITLYALKDCYDILYRDEHSRRESAPLENVAESESDDEGGAVPASADAAPKKSIRARWGIPTVRIRDSNGNIITINSEEPVPFESEHFKGLLLLMVRTDGELAEYNRYENHFSGKQRKFEFQFQVYTIYSNCIVIMTGIGSAEESSKGHADDGRRNTGENGDGSSHSRSCIHDYEILHEARGEFAIWLWRRGS